MSKRFTIAILPKEKQQGWVKKKPEFSASASAVNFIDGFLNFLKTDLVKK